ncbi:MAG: hypothetical protein HRT44_09690 [Bdellovibrionales bacterium]|nr:hypothetical protein [Bdellovibrionales bacterium]NQZ19510.1 hypothetical protein [Bdellovibrionales bacterium]
MKRLLLFVATYVLIFTNPLYAADNLGFFKWATTQDTHIDLNQDGSPDVLREYSEGRLKKMIYRNSKKPWQWSETYYHNDGFRFKRSYDGGFVVKIEKFEKSKTKSKTTVYHYKNKRLHKKTVSIFKKPKRVKLRGLASIRRAGTHIVKEFVRQGKKLVLKSVKSSAIEFPAEVTNAGSTIETEIRQRSIDEIDAYIDRAGANELLGFRITGCSEEDNKVVTAASHLVFKKILPCVNNLNPDLATAVASHLIENQPTVQCGALDPSDGAIARAPLDCQHDNCEIMLHQEAQSEETKARASGDALLRAYLMGNTLLHETLHHLGIDHREPAVAGGDGSWDAAYGCPSACTPPAASGSVSPRMGCEICSTVLVDGKDSNYDQNMCEDQGNYAPEQW